MIEAIIMDKLLGIAGWFNVIGWISSAFIFAWIMIRGIRDVSNYYEEEKHAIDYYNISIRENKFIAVTIIFCIIQSIILFNPLTIKDFSYLQDLYNAFEGQYGYLIMFSINYLGYRIFSIPTLALLLWHYKCILSGNKGKGVQYDYNEQITRSKFINTTVIIIMALVLQVTLYLLIPSNDFIIHNIAGINM